MTTQIEKPELQIDEEFKNLIQPLSEKEYMALDESISDQGKLLSPIITWNGVIIDGHNRYEICKEHGIDYETKELEFEDRNAAKEWIIKNQFARRNLNLFLRCELVIKQRAIFVEKAKLKKQNSAENCDTRSLMADDAGVSHDSVSRVEAILNNFSDKVSDKDLKKLRDGEISINAVYSKIKDKNPSNDDKSIVVAKLIDSLVNGCNKKLQQLPQEENISEEDKAKITTIIEELQKLVA